MAKKLTRATETFTFAFVTIVFSSEQPPRRVFNIIKCEAKRAISMNTRPKSVKKQRLKSEKERKREKDKQKCNESMAMK